MRKLAALVQHILQVTGLPPENLFAFADQGDLYPMGRERAPLRPEPGEAGEPRAQVELGIFRYDGVVQIERYPGSGAAFAALISTWLADCDPERNGLDDPSLNITLNVTGGDCDLDLAVEFEERLTAIEDPDGNIPFNGKLWSIAPLEITPVEELAALRAVNVGAGKLP